MFLHVVLQLMLCSVFFVSFLSPEQLPLLTLGFLDNYIKITQITCQGGPGYRGYMLFVMQTLNHPQQGRMREIHRQ